MPPLFKATPKNAQRGACDDVHDQHQSETSALHAAVAAGSHMETAGLELGVGASSDDGATLTDPRLADPNVRHALLAHLDTLERGGAPAPRSLVSEPPMFGRLQRGVSSGILKASGASFRNESELVEFFDKPTLKDMMIARDAELASEAAEVTAAVSWDEDRLLDEATSELPEIDQKELYEYLNRDRAASRIQQFWRMKALGFDAARILQALHIDEGAALVRPSRAVARELVQGMLPHRTDAPEVASACERRMSEAVQ